MKKMLIKYNVKVLYDPLRPKAHYSLDGVHWMNAGELAECLLKAGFGLEPRKDASTRYDVEDDIPTLNASVKAHKFSLCNVVLGETREETIEKFFATVHANKFYYVANETEKRMNGELEVYEMSKDEFREFVELFGAWEEGRKIVRGNVTKAVGGILPMKVWLKRKAR